MRKALLLSVPHRQYTAFSGSPCQTTLSCIESRALCLRGRRHVSRRPWTGKRRLATPGSMWDRMFPYAYRAAYLTRASNSSRALPSFCPYGASRRLRPHRHLFNLYACLGAQGPGESRQLRPIGNVFEEFALVAAGLVLCAAYSPWLLPCATSGLLRAPIRHLPDLVWHRSYRGYARSPEPNPGWLPPSKMFWLTPLRWAFLRRNLDPHGHFAPLASRLLTAEIVIFELLFWIPNLHAAPSSHFNWAGNAISIALAGAAWVVSDSISASAKAESSAVSRSVSAP